MTAAEAIGYAALAIGLPEHRRLGWDPLENGAHTLEIVARLRIEVYWLEEIVRISVRRNGKLSRIERLLDLEAPEKSLRRAVVFLAASVGKGIESGT